VNRQFDDLDLGFVDAAIVALAQTLGLSRVATTDRRHFDPLAAAFRFNSCPDAAPGSLPRQAASPRSLISASSRMSPLIAPGAAGDRY
jgi:hypothetical protein